MKNHREAALLLLPRPQCWVSRGNKTRSFPLGQSFSAYCHEGGPLGGQEGGPEGVPMRVKKGSRIGSNGVQQGLQIRGVHVLYRPISLLTVEFNNLYTKHRKNSLVCGFDAASWPNIFRVFEKLWAVFNAGKKVFNPAQAALPKILKKEAKI